MTADDQPQSAAGEEPPATGEEAIETSAEASDVGTTGPEPGARRRVGGWLRRHWVAVMAAAVLVSVAAAGSVYWTIYRPDRLTDTTAQEQVLDVARAGTEALLSYSPETVDTNDADSAQVLAFVNQVTTSKERPTPALATSSVMMTLVREDGRWLIAEFNPI